MSDVAYNDDYVRCRYCDCAFSINQPLPHLKKLSLEKGCRHERYEFQCPACGSVIESFIFHYDEEDGK